MKRSAVRAAGLALVLATVACGGTRTYPAPAEPDAAIRAFMEAVRVNSLLAMGELWGSERGPAVTYMNREELEMRLTVMRTYLQHESFEIVTGNESVRAAAGERILQVRIRRAGCAPVVPFTLVRYRQGWLVKAVDLEAVGNPVRRCTPR